MKFVRVKHGVFRMGSSVTGQEEPDEQPPHDVAITYDFFASIYEVRRRDFQSVMGWLPELQPDEDADGPNAAELPVVGVDWHAANDFCHRLSSRPAERNAGRYYRLPTEAEWEYCCRAGTSSEFATGDRLSSTVACYRPAVSEGQPDRTTMPVGSYPPNAWGLHDTHGNVWEWCLDWYGNHYYRETPEFDPPGPSQGSRRVIRGGGWNAPMDLCRSAFRDSKEPDARTNYLGFRIVCLGGRFEGNGTQHPDIPSSPISIADMVERVEPAVVRINVRGSGISGQGSGFLVFDNSTVVTNYHVIEQARDVSVEFANGTTVEILGTVALMPDKDLAFLRLKAACGDASPLMLAKSLPRKGDLAIAFGSPLGLSFTTSEGIVSAVRDQADMQASGIDFGPRVTWIQMTTPISPGNSGGPLMNQRGEVIGVNTIVFRGQGGIAQNLNFAVSALDFPEGTSLASVPSPLNPNQGDVAEALKRLEDILSQSSHPR